MTVIPGENQTHSNKPLHDLGLTTTIKENNEK